MTEGLAAFRMQRSWALQLYATVPGYCYCYYSRDSDPRLRWPTTATPPTLVSSYKPGVAAPVPGTEVGIDRLTVTHACMLVHTIATSYSNQRQRIIHPTLCHRLCGTCRPKGGNSQGQTGRRSSDAGPATPGKQPPHCGGAASTPADRQPPRRQTGRPCP